MRFVLALLLAFCLTPLSSLCNLESEIKVLKSKKFKTIDQSFDQDIKLASMYMIIEDFSSMYHQLLKLHKVLQSPSANKIESHLLVRYHTLWGGFYYKKNKLLASVKHFEKALDINITNSKFKHEQGLSYANYSYVLSRMKLYEESILNANLGFNVVGGFSSKENSTKLILLYRLGSIYDDLQLKSLSSKDQKNREKYLRLFNENLHKIDSMLPAFKETSFDSYLEKFQYYRTLDNIAPLYSVIGDYEKAERIFKTVQDFALLNNEPILYTESKIFELDFGRKFNNPQDKIFSLLQSIQFLQDKNVKRVFILKYLLATEYLNVNDFKNAEYWFLEVIKSRKDFQGDNLLLINSFIQLAAIYGKQKKYVNGYNAYAQTISLIEDNDELKSKYQEQRANIILKKEQEKNQKFKALEYAKIENMKGNQLITVLGWIVAFLFIGLLLYYVRSVRNKDRLLKAEIELVKEAQLRIEMESIYELKAEMNREFTKKESQNTIARNLHDDIGSSLAALNYYIEDIININKGENVGDILKVKGEINSIYEYVREYIHGLYSDNNNSNFTNRFIEFLQLFNNIESIATEVNLPINEIELKLSMEQKNHLFRIIKELIANACKHSEATEISVDLTFSGTTSYILEYKDNGKGFREKSLNNGVGFNNLAERISFLKGEFSISNNFKNGNKKGVIINIQFPLN